MEVIDGLACTTVDRDESFEHQPGFVIEFQSCPRVFDTIQEYDPLMVPPIWLVNDPRSRYPHGLQIISKKVQASCLSQ
jgi:hypothetical protein